MKQILTVFMLLAFCSAQAQIRASSITVRNAFTEVQAIPAKKISPLSRWINPDPQRSYRLSNPLFTQRIFHSPRASDTYWTAYMTTQSMRKGKVGTYYYWDVQGNLRESRTFFDINRKNKYSFKLVIPRQ